jgi:hypothetical protein
MTAPKGSPTHTQRIARNTFDPDAIAEQCQRAAIFWNAWAELQGHGVRFYASMRDIDIRELWAGASKDAESDPEYGWFLRRARVEGFFSQSLQVLEALETRGLNERNSQRRKQLRKQRNIRPARDFAAAVNDHIDRSIAVLETIAAGNAMIDRGVRATPDCRDVAVEWPHRLVGNMAVPLNAPHKRQ